MTIDELYGRCTELASSAPSLTNLRFMHETLVLCCAEGLKEAGTGFGNLFSQVDYLCKRCGMKTTDRGGRTTLISPTLSNGSTTCGY